MDKIHYRVTWTIDVWAESPKAAAKEALEIQRDPESTATFFDVCRITAVVGTSPISIDALKE